jgi:tetratricopeptide (TPR) repeat protein
VACLDENTVVAFFQSSRAAGVEERVNAHAAECEACRKLLAGFAAMSPVDASPPLLSTTPGPKSDDRPSMEALLPPGARLGRYVVLSLLGMGGLGVVYEAYDPELDRRIAVKLLRRLSPDEETATAGRELLQREARALAKLSHPNVVAVHDVGVLGGRVFIAMEFVAGGTLRGWLSAEKRGFRRVLDALHQAGEGLAAAHDAGLVHRDFKPDNVLVRTDGRVCVTDFGLARAGLVDAAPSPQDPLGGSSLHTATGELVGTPVYMAPELWIGHAADARSDQYAFGVSLFEGLCGARPHAGVTLGALKQSILSGASAELLTPDCAPPWLARAVMRALSTDPSARFASMRDLLAALAEPRSKKRVMVAVAAAVVTIASVTPAVLTARARAAAPTAVCQGGEEKMRDLWDAPQQRAAQQAFESTGASHAGVALSAVDSALAGFSRDWVATYGDACRATRVRGEQSEQLLDQRMVCLEQERKVVAALASAFAHADRKTVDHAVEAASAIELPSVSCTAEALRGTKPWPKDPAARAQLEDVQTQIARAISLREQGRFEQARDVGRAALGSATTAGYEPLQADIELRLAAIETASGDALASKHALEAATMAQSNGLDDLAARAWTALVLLAARNGDAGTARLYAQIADATINRRGGDAVMLRGRLLLYQSYVDSVEQRFSAAVDSSTSALALMQQAAGERSREFCNALLDRALVLGNVGRYEEALADYNRVVALLSDVLGAGHPETLDAVFGQAQALEALGRYEPALERISYALPGMIETHGADSGIATAARGLTAKLMCELGRCGEALAVVEQALGSWSAAGTNADPADGGSLYLVRAGVRLGVGDIRGAERDGRKSLELAPSDSDRAASLQVLSKAARARGGMTEAVQDARRAVDLLEKSSPDTPLLAPALGILGELLAARGQDAEARDVVERAVTLFDAHPGDPHLIEAARALRAKMHQVSRSPP